MDDRNITGDAKVLIGMEISGTFYDVTNKRYNPNKEPLNWDNSYQRLIFNTYKHLFYNYVDQPEYLFGVEHENDGDSGEYEDRTIRERLTVLKIPQPLFGETIVPSTLVINDRSNENFEINLTDDGFTNIVYATSSTFSTGSNLGTVFSDVGELNSWINPDVSLTDYYSKYNPQNERFGYCVSAWNDYLLIGCPMDSNSFADSKAGKADLLKFDPENARYRYIKSFYNVYTQNALGHQETDDVSYLMLTEDGNFITPNTSSINDRFGRCISLQDGFCAIGSSQDSGWYFDNDQGSVYVYDKYKGGADHWGLVNIYIGENQGDDFGYSVSITKDWLAVGAPGYNTGSGAVYIFRKEILGQTFPTQSLIRILSDENSDIAADAASLDNEVTSDYLTDEEYPGNPDQINDHAYILYQKIISPNATQGDYFGGSLSLSGSLLVVGNSKTNPNGLVQTFYLNQNGTGSYYNTGSWDYLQQISGSITQSGSLNFFSSSIYAVTHSLQYYGNSLCLNNNILYVGSPSDLWYYEYQGASTLYKAGAVYVYQYSQSQFYLVDKLYANETGSTTNQYGYSVSSKNGYLMVGSLIGDTSISASYNPTINSNNPNYYNIQHYSDSAQSVDDNNNVNGKCYFYQIELTNSGSYSYSLPIQNGRKNKDISFPKTQYGYSVAVAENGYGFVGDPVLSYTTQSDTSFTDQNLLKEYYPKIYSGSVYFYYLDSITGSAYSHHVGNIFYKNGIIAITSTGSVSNKIIDPTKSKFGFDIQYVSQYSINEYEVLCPVSCGEFNVSTNPSATIRYPILFDVNNDGIFDQSDIDLILRFITKTILYNNEKFIFDTYEDENGIITEQSTDWWNKSVLITEFVDTIYVGALLASIPSQSEYIIDNIISPSIYQNILNLYNSGYLDLNGDGVVDQRDMAILINYFYGNFNFNSIRNNVGSLIDVSTIIENLNYYTGKTTGIQINPNFLNYQESASIDKTGSYLSPYVTTIGLYSKDYELVAVAKLGKPYKITSEFPITFRVTFDF